MKDPDWMPRSVGDVGRVWPEDGAMHLSYGIATQIVEKVGEILYNSCEVASHMHIFLNL